MSINPKLVWVCNICGNEDFDPKVAGCEHGTSDEKCLMLQSYEEVLK